MSDGFMEFPCRVVTMEPVDDELLCVTTEDGRLWTIPFTSFEPTIVRDAYEIVRR